MQTAGGRNGKRAAPSDDSGTVSEPASDPLTPAFLLQLIKLLKRKETLLERAKLHNDAMKVGARAPGACSPILSSILYLHRRSPCC
jgi:hypothetical protein